MQEEFEPVNERTPRPEENRPENSQPENSQPENSQRDILERLRARLKENRIPRTLSPSVPLPPSVPSLDSESDSKQSDSKQSDSKQSDSTPSDSTSSNGWNQGDGRRADNLVLYEHRIPESIRRRIEPVKGTHFRFRNLSDEAAFLEAIVGSNPFRAVYQPTGKRDVTLTGSNGELIGHVHLLHVNAPDIQHPEKYYVKFYLFDFVDAAHVQMVKRNIVSFFQKSGKATSSRITPASPASRSRVAPASRFRVAPASRFKTRRYPFRPRRFRRRNTRGSKMKIEGTSKKTRKVFRRR